MGAEGVGLNRNLMISIGEIQRDEMEYASDVGDPVTLQVNVSPTCLWTRRIAYSIIMPTLQAKIQILAPLSHTFRLMTRSFSHLPKVTKHTLQLKTRLVSFPLARIFPKSSEPLMVISVMITSILIFSFRGCRASGGVLEFESHRPIT